MGFSITGRTFTTIDGRELKVEDYFRLDRDFAIEGNSGFVKHDSLLRVCKALFHIVNRDVHIHMSKEGFASASVTYALLPKDFQPKNVLDKPKTYYFTSSGDCTKQNAPPAPANIYFTAMAETRASGRALRFLLGVEFCTKEEIGDRKPVAEEDSDELISKNVVSLIEKKFMGEFGINIEQMRKLLKKDEKEFPDLASLSVEDGAELMRRLNRSAEKLAKENEGKK